MLSSLGERKNKFVCVTNIRNSEGNGVERGSGGLGRALGNVGYSASTQTLAVISGQSIIVLDACFCPSQADGFPSLLSYAAWLVPHLQSSPESSKRSLECRPYLGVGKVRPGVAVLPRGRDV